MKNGRISIKDISLIAMFSAVITVSAWLSLPVLTIPVTLQTFGVFAALLLLGGRNGLISILVYIFLGLVGVPVFSSFRAGPSALFGPTGGYIIGFAIIGLIYLLTEKLTKDRLFAKASALLIGLIVCYAFGTVWFVLVYQGDEKIGFISALSTCVLPFIIPDILKLALALVIYKAVNPVLGKITG